MEQELCPSSDLEIERGTKRERERAEAGRHLVAPFSLFLSLFRLLRFSQEKPPLWTEGRGSSDNLSLPQAAAAAAAGGGGGTRSRRVSFFCPRGNFRKVKGKTKINHQNQQNVEISLRLRHAQNQQEYENANHRK